MDKVFVGGLFILYALTLLAIHRWIHAMPARLWGIARAELGRAAEENAARAERAPLAAERDTAAELAAATALVVELRTLLEGVASVRADGAQLPRAASEGRQALPSVAASADEPEDEPTQVASRPAPRLLAVAGGGAPSR